MHKVYFVKMNDKEDVDNIRYTASDDYWYGEIKKGDYAFIKLQGEDVPASVRRLWRLKEDVRFEGGQYVAYFEEVYKFLPIPLYKFEALNIFMLNMNLLNKCNKQTKKLSFIELGIVDYSFFDSIIKRKDSFEKYITDDASYRRIVMLEKESDIDLTSSDVQFYKDGEIWQMAMNLPFVGQDFRDRYDSSQYSLFEKYGKKGKNFPKDKVYSFLNGQESDYSMMGLWDLFCGNVKETNAETVSHSTKVKKRVEFIEYCKQNGVKQASGQYENGIRAVEGAFDINIDEEFERDRCESLIKKIEKSVQAIPYEQQGNKRNWINYVNKYLSYKDSLSQIVSEVHDSLDYYSFDQAMYCGINKVIYGTPGCGKSYYLENSVLKREGIDIDNVIRTTFYQDYTNTDFVGQILPKVTGNDVSYDFVPGPFCRALKAAIESPEEKVALIIEELNRGNAPAIFGDIFQLLDRVEGESRYAIFNYNIQEYLKSESTYKYDFIKIPRNMYIYATMNTSDQNVYTLDTAFKRRWKFEKLMNDFNEEDANIKVMQVPGFDNVTWEKFVKVINVHIIKHAISLSAEDKQLGKYFVDRDMLLNDDDTDGVIEGKIYEFAYKVFEYLWSDVAKFNRKDWFQDDINSLDDLIYSFTHHDPFFVTELARELPLAGGENEI